tara:strand:+ start:149 stop:898 length:750 start_codon:yes stop_codon:yes gene_type:complete
MAENQFPSEVIDLPSEGKLYPEESPLREGKIEIKYMTAKEEDILTSQNLIKKGLVIEKLLDSLILTKGVKSEDLIIGDKNALMVAARILAYGPEYACEVTNPNTGEKLTHTFNIADCPFIKLPKGVDGNNFDFELPVSKQKITFKLLSGKDERMINNELDKIKKLGTQIIPELTTRLRYLITSVDGETKQNVINAFVENMLSRDSLSLRQEITKVTPDIDLSQEIDIEGDTVKVDIPMTVNFFWPDTES